MFKEHGTKILGTVVTVIGAISVMSPEQVAALFGDRGPAVMMTIGGILTILRGLQNSGVLPGGPSRP